MNKLLPNHFWLCNNYYDMNRIKEECRKSEREIARQIRQATLFVLKGLVAGMLFASATYMVLEWLSGK